MEHVWRYRPFKNDLALVSMTYPEAKFSVGTAMCLADAALVVHSGKERRYLGGRNGDAEVALSALTAVPPRPSRNTLPA